MMHQISIQTLMWVDIASSLKLRAWGEKGTLPFSTLIIVDLIAHTVTVQPVIAGLVPAIHRRASGVSMRAQGARLRHCEC